ncbi:unnamed protein product [[Candida] boidinii]|nr:hypothetical protein BVG19_g5664 [[Candida] boidinii]OWB52261.1 hypothetical protein B5S27_g3833 [[Candida] boidinii]GME95291.1 unnamed protein product [[Candida] boidinii]
MPQSKYPGSPSFRTPGSPISSSRDRQTSIVEMLSTPPPLDSDITNIDLNTSHSISHSTNNNNSYNNSNNVNNNNNNSNNNNNIHHSGSISSHTSSIAQQLNSSISNSSNSHTNTDSSDSNNNNFNTNSIPAPSSSLSRNPSVSSQASSVFSNGHPGCVDWQEIQLADLVEKNKLIIINSKISVEEAFDTLVKNNLTSVPVEEFENDLNCLTFDYTDLNSYLLLVLNKLKMERLSSLNYEPKSEIPDLIKKAQRGEQVPVSFVIRLANKNPFIKLNESDNLANVVEILGSGVHRVAITKNQQLTGILSQRRLIKYLWDNARRFPSMEPLLSSSLHSLGIGSANVITIYGDQLLIEALVKMDDLMISSLAVVDRNYNLLGNISVTDVRLVSKSSKSDLLYKSCLHFISIILGSRGLENGKDSFPIFHVTNSSSLGRTIAKLVATKSHRLWIVKQQGGSTSGASSQSTIPTSVLSPNSSSYSINDLPQHQQQQQQQQQQQHLQHANSQSSVFSQQSPSIPSAIPMASNSSSNNNNIQQSPTQQQPSYLTEKEASGRPGKLIGVVSLTDILSVLAKTLGKDHVDPQYARRHRRRSSSSSSRSATSSLEQFRKSVSDPADR